MIKTFLVLFFSFFISKLSFSQNNGILPLTGIKYFKEGINGNIEVKIDDAVLLSNRVTINKEIEIRLQSPTGFIQKNKLFYPGVEMNVISLKGQLLSKVLNVLKDSEKGFSTSGKKDVVLKLVLTPAILKNETGCIIKLRFYDLLSSSQLTIEFPVLINKMGEVLHVSKKVNQLKTYNGSLAFENGVKIKSIKTSIDTSIRVSPKMAYASIILEGIKGTSMNEILAGKESFWVFGNNMDQVTIPDKLLKQVKGAMEDDIVNYTLKIPFKLKTRSDKYYIRFRWESRDMKKVIDLVINQ